MLKNRLAVLGAAFVFIALSSTQLRAQSPGWQNDSVYQGNFFLGLHLPKAAGNDATLTILDPGVNGSDSICADIYVLNPSEEMEACCGCLLTPDEILSGLVVENLLSNNVSPITLANGVIKIISSSPVGSTCSPSGSGSSPSGSSSGASGSTCDPSNPNPTTSVIAWLTRLDTAFAGASGATTTQFAASSLSLAEESTLATTCGDILHVGSGHGICKCPTEPTNH
jgi:hypothetical protein